MKMQPSHFSHHAPNPNPPQALFKYLAPTRVSDVLESKTLKFTKMSNTNDIFEVRSTFRRIAGPRFRELIANMQSELTSKAKMEAGLISKIAERMGRSPSRKERRAALAAFYKGGMDKKFRDELDLGASQFADYLNTDEVHEQFLQMFGNDMLCLSLSEDFDISPMWAHYADNHTGFVIELSTDHQWFKNKKDPSKTRLHQVHYFDGILDEILENPEAAFGSKTKSWSYEKEWRIYCGPKDIEKSIPAEPEPIHLISFPSDLVKSVIVGSRASTKTVDYIKTVLSTHYPLARLFAARPNTRTSLIELGAL